MKVCWVFNRMTMVLHDMWFFAMHWTFHKVSTCTSVNYAVIAVQVQSMDLEGQVLC